MHAIERYAAAKNSHDVDAALALCSEDSVYESPALGLRVEGRERLRPFYEAFFAALPDYSGEFEGMATGEDTAVVWGCFGGTTSGDFMGAAVEPGRRIDVPVTFVCTFRDGLLTRDVGYFDAATLAEQLGLELAQLRPRASGRPFVERFAEFWSNPDPARVPELVAEDALAHWPGVDPIPGSEYPAFLRRMTELVSDLDFQVTAHAEAGEYVFISWRSRGTVGGDRIEWSGIDRMRLRDGKAVEVFVAYDTAPFAKLGVRAAA